MPTPPRRGWSEVSWACCVRDPILILLILVVIMSNLSPVFFAAQNLGNVLVQSAAIAILAIGQLLVILTRGIDLSVGSTLALSSVVGATVFAEYRQRGLHVLVDASRGALIGAINGLGYVFGKLPHPFIVTLATLSIARGLALGISGGQPISGMPDIVNTLGAGSRPARRGCRTPRSWSRASPSRSGCSRRGGLGPVDLRGGRQPRRRPSPRHPANRGCSFRCTC